MDGEVVKNKVLRQKINNNFAASSIQQKLADKINLKLHQKDFDLNTNRIYNDRNSIEKFSAFLPPVTEFLQKKLLKNASNFSFKGLNEKTEDLQK